MLSRIGRSLCFTVLLLASTVVAIGEEGDRAEVSTVTIDGRQVEVRWNDGDSFKIVDPTRIGRGIRLTGYNTLENHGPVPRWGDWTRVELLAIADEATAAARAGRWN